MTMHDGRPLLEPAGDPARSHHTHLETTMTDPKPAAESADRADLRQRIAEALWQANGPAAAEEANVDAVLAVLPAPTDQAALERVRTVLETEAVVGRSALEYRGLIASALMAAVPAAAPPPADQAADGPVDDMRELYAVQHAIRDAGGEMTRDVHNAVDALREVWDCEVRRLQELRRMADETPATEAQRCACTHAPAMHTGPGRFCAVPGCDCEQYAAGARQDGARP